MNKITTIICLGLIIGSVIPKLVNSQAYIDFSKYAGGSNVEEVTHMQVINGETYLIGSTRSANFPVTNGTAYKGETDITIIKYGVTGNVIYSTYLGGRGNDIVSLMQVINGEVYLTGSTDSINFPVTNGSVFNGLKDIFVTKLTSSGQIAFSTYLGGKGIETTSFNGLQITGNAVIITGTTGSAGLPMTGNSVYHGGVSDAFISKLNAADGSVISSRFYGGNKADNVFNTNFENGDIYLVGSTFSTDMAVTIGSSPNDTVENGYATKVSGTNLDIIYSRYLGGNSIDNITASRVGNGVLHIAGNTYSSNYPVTNGTTLSGIIYDYIDGFYTRLNTDGSILYSTYLVTGDLDGITQMEISNGDAYITGISRSPYDAEKKLLIFKLNAIGNLIYAKKITLGLGFPRGLSFQVLNGDFYFSGICLSPLYPVTNGSQFFNGGTGFFTHLDPSGNILFSTFLGKMNTLLPLKTGNGKFYFLGNTDLHSYPVSNPDPISGGNDNILIILRSDGSDYYSRYLGGSQTESPSVFQVDMEKVYIGGKTTSNDYPVTNNVPYTFNGDQCLTKISFCPMNYFLTNDTLAPKTQTVCKFGLAQNITSTEINVPGDSLPFIYRNSSQSQQQPIKANYQWQSANSPAGPWADIPDAVFKDYRPVLGDINQYYRRLAYSLPECGSILIHTSDTAAALVNLLTAPVISSVEPFITCPGSPINIGGSPTVTEGNPPYTSYAWDPIADSVSNPVVSPLVSTIYTLIVTDAAGCQQIGQNVVLTYRADAGPDKGACGGVAASIGTPAITGIPGTGYNWQPGTGLSSTNIAQPFANPVTPAVYSLTLTIPKSGGGTCETKDSVTITPVAAPLNPGFAGADKVSCLGDSILVGINPEPGFNYTWSPGSYLTGNTLSSVFYYSGNTTMPVPNPGILYVTAQKSGCSFSDETVVATIEARAGLDGCGPRLVGMPDRTPNINETYLWTKISGPGNFTGATDLPQVPVSASIGGLTIYQLTVTYNGHSCSDDINVPSICTGCWTLVDVQASYLCPDFDINGGNVALIAYTSTPDALFTWTPQEGLTNYTGNVVHLTDNVPRVYTVTATNANDTTVRCSYSILVNDPAFSQPVFAAADTVTCFGVPVTIGAAPVAGYTYEWTGSGLSSNLISNPVATVTAQTAFPVKISDGNGCQLKDTVLVNVQNIRADAGADWLICSNSVIKPGTPAQPNTNYLWEPEASPWQNGTSQFSAQPEVFVATNLSFVLTATTTAGCETKDTVNVTVSDVTSLPDAPDKFVCLRSSVMIGNPALPGVTYQWTPVTGLSNPNIAQPMASPAITTTYTVTATFPGSCAGSASDQVTVTVGSAFFNLPDISYCPANGAVALGNGAPLNMVSYNWQPQQLVSNFAIPNPSTLNPPPNSATLFTLLVTNTDGCSYRDTVRITPLLTPPSAGPDKLICKGQTATLGSAANVTGPTISYSWNPGSYLNNPSAPNPVFTGVTGGVFTYIVTKTDNVALCSSADTVTIRVIDSLVIPMNPLTVCQNSCLQIGTNPVAGIRYEWTPVTGLSDPAISNPVACIGSGQVIYTLTATDLNGCSTSSNLILDVNSLSAPQITIPPVAACVGDTNAMFNPALTPPGNYFYTWSPDNGTLSDIHSLTPQIAITGTGATQYLLQVSDTVTGCFNTGIGNVVASLCPTLATIGDFMWFDTDEDGLQDNGESGVSGITVRLFNSAGFLAGSTVTDANGFYYFIDVPPGTGYYVRFDLPAGYLFTLRNVGGVAAANNSKANQNGRSTNFNLAAGETKYNIDAGIILNPCGPVPVTLLSFTARLINREVLLNWQTTAEYNNKYFDVERSTNGITFSAIGRVNGNGTTSLPHSYSLTDYHPLQGSGYYRLKQADTDNKITYSPIERIWLDIDETSTVFYNNQYNNIQFQFSKPQDKTRLKLYASNGQLIKTVSLPDNIINYIWDLPVLAKGIYMVQIVNEKSALTKRFFVD